MVGGKRSLKPNRLLFPGGGKSGKVARFSQGLSGKSSSAPTLRGEFVSTRLPGVGATLANRVRRGQCPLENSLLGFTCTLAVKKAARQALIFVLTALIAVQSDRFDNWPLPTAHCALARSRSSVA